MDSPSTVTRPRCGGSRRRIVLRSVVLPQPLGPSKHSTSPPASSKLTPWPTVRPGYPKLRPSTARRIALRPSPARHGEQPDEEGRADEGGEHPERNLERSGGAGQGVHREQEASAEQHRGREQPGEVRTHEEPGEVRD